jgi:hypothetical protein
MSIWIGVAKAIFSGPIDTWVQQRGQARIVAAQGKADVARTEADAKAKERILAITSEIERGKSQDEQTMLQLQADLEAERVRLEDEIAAARAARASAGSDHEQELWERDQKFKMAQAEWLCNLVREATLQHAEATIRLGREIDKQYGDEHARLLTDHSKRRKQVTSEVKKICGDGSLPAAVKDRLCADAFRELDRSDALIDAVHLRISQDIPKLRDQVMKQMQFTPMDILPLLSHRASTPVLGQPEVVKLLERVPKGN